MIALFHDAGLKQPTMLCEIPVAGGPDSPFYAEMALTLRGLLPQVEKIGAATAAEIDIDTLEDLAQCCDGCARRGSLPDAVPPFISRPIHIPLRAHFTPWKTSPPSA
jgi:hypothetical protein